MLKNPEIVNILNGLLKIELTASDVYWQQSAILENLGYMKLAKAKKDEAKEERQHASKLIDRVLLLGGDVVFARDDKSPGSDVRAMLGAGLRLEQEVREAYVLAMSAVYAAGDYVTWAILAENQEENEDGIHFHEQQLGLMDAMGLDSYLQAQM